MPELRSFEGSQGVYTVLSAEPVIYGRLSLFFAAADPRTGNPVLIKSFGHNPDSGSSVRSFYREIEALRRLRHPNILDILDYSTGHGGDTPPFLVLPWCRGGNLRELNPSGSFIPLEAALPVLKQLAAAVDFAHQQGVVHGDIKPENVLLSEDKRQVYLADFGMSKYFDVADRVRNTGEGGEGQPAVGGTSAYLSPEQLDSNTQSPRSDIYSLGLLAFELLAGRLPFNVRAPLYRQIHARVAGELLVPSSVNPALAASLTNPVMAPLATDPLARPPSAIAFCEMLAGTRPAPKYNPLPSKEKRRRRLEAWQDLDAAGKAAVIVALIAALAGLVKGAIDLIPKMLGKP